MSLILAIIGSIVAVILAQLAPFILARIAKGRADLLDNPCSDFAETDRLIDFPGIGAIPDPASRGHCSASCCRGMGSEHGSQHLRGDSL